MTPRSRFADRRLPGAIVAVVALAAVLAGSGCGAQRQHRQIQRAGEELRFDLAELYVKRGALQAAAPLLQRVLAEAPRDVRARVLYGSVLRDLGLYPQAEKELRFAIGLDDQRADARGALAILLDLTRRSDEALGHHRAAVVLAPGDARVRNNYGFSLYLAGQTDAAIAHLERALALDPGLAQAHLNLGFAYGRAGRLDDAERAFRSAVPEAAALHDMALVLDARGDAAAAIAMRERAHDLDPSLDSRDDGDRDFDGDSPRDRASAFADDGPRDRAGNFEDHSPRDRTSTDDHRDDDHRGASHRGPGPAVPTGDLP